MDQRKKQADEIKPVSPMDLTEFRHVKTDPQGSWTGVPENPYEAPVQDVDDL